MSTSSYPWVIHCIGIWIFPWLFHSFYILKCYPFYRWECVTPFFNAKDVAKMWPGSNLRDVIYECYLRGASNWPRGEEGYEAVCTLGWYYKKLFKFTVASVWHIEKLVTFKDRIPKKIIYNNFPFLISFLCKITIYLPFPPPNKCKAQSSTTTRIFPGIKFQEILNW